jgi:hypothetical protein
MGSSPPWWHIRRRRDSRREAGRDFQSRHDRRETSKLASNSTCTSIWPRTESAQYRLSNSVIYQQISIAGGGPAKPALLSPRQFSLGRYRQSFPRAGLTHVAHGGTIASASTSLGEASARIQATDLERRETPRVRTAPPGLRVEPKWLPAQPDTPCSAKAQTRGVRLLAVLPVAPHPMCNVLAPVCALAVRR